MVDSDNIIGFDLVGKVKRLRFYKTQVLFLFLKRLLIQFIQFKE